MASTEAEKVGRIVEMYMKAAPAEIKESAVVIADTAKLMRVLLADSLGVSPEEVPIASAIEAAIAVVKDAKENAAT